MKERAAMPPQEINIKQVLRKGLRVIGIKSRASKPEDSHLLENAFIPLAEYRKPNAPGHPISETVLFNRLKPQRSAMTR